MKGGNAGGKPCTKGKSAGKAKGSGKAQGGELQTAASGKGLQMVPVVGTKGARAPDHGPCKRKLEDRSAYICCASLCFVGPVTCYSFCFALMCCIGCCWCHASRQATGFLV